jgi:transposase
MGFKNHVRHRGFVVEAYYENSRSLIATQRAFRTRFAIGRNASVPDRKTILLWVSNLRATGSTLKRKSPGRPRTVRTPENVEAVRASIQPPRSARKHAMALGISSRNLRRILHADLKLHPYKMMLAQELSEKDHANRRAISAEILEQVSPCDFFLWGYLKEKVFKHF